MNTMIKTLTSLALVAPAVLGLSIATVSAEEQEKRIEIMINQENDNDASVELNLNGTSERFTLPELVEGETRTIVTESGSTVTVSKLDGSTTVNLGGEDIKLMHLDGDIGANFEWISDDNMSFGADDKIFIIGGNLSEEVKQALQNTLDSYGVQKDLVFPDGGDGENNIMVISDVSGDDEKEVHSEIKLIRKHSSEKK
ncbi:MAG: hypothetical protein HWD86_03760 [Kangiellaceae bacterium]|nr:hypothetical protein [Kangiellaceae bacterium]